MKKIINIIFLTTIFILLTFSTSKTASKYAITMKKDLNVNILIDKTKPNVNIIDINKSIIDNTNNYAIEHAKIEFCDKLSGIANATYKYNPNEENFNECESNELLNNMIFTEKGWYDIEITDKAGNFATYHFLICSK